MQVYEGTVGNHPVRLGLAFEPGGAVAGRYGSASSQGTMLGNGEFWFDGAGQAIAINN